MNSGMHQPGRFLTLAAWCLMAGFAAAIPGRAGEPPPLFDGQTLEGWTTLEGGPVTRGWEVVDGAIHLVESEERVGHLITAREFGNFVLSFEFRIAPQGNSGLKYRVRDFGGSILGCEYQIYDDDHPTHPVEPKNSTGALYDLYEPMGERLLHPAGEYNTAKIVVLDDVIEHWLNGRRIVRAVVGSPEWRSRIAASKFHDDPGFGENRFGRIMLTDHGSEVWYRNFEFTELPTTQPLPTPDLVTTPPSCRTVCGRCSFCPGWRGVGSPQVRRSGRSLPVCDRRCRRATRVCP